MPFKIRLKKSRQYNVVSKNLFVISVELLDRSVIECTLSSDSTGKDCINNVCQRVSLQQPEFFGLRFVFKRHGLRWIELSRPMKKQLEKNACEFRLYLAVMFYIPDVVQLKDEVTRYHYFLQLKKDIIEGHLPCTTAQAVMLTAYGLQAEFGNHDPEKHTCEYLKDFILFPKQMSADPHKLEEVMAEVLNAHKRLNGLIPSLAEINYIQFAQQLEGYGHEFFPSKNDQGRELFLGISLLGILAKYRDSQKSPFFMWTDIVNLTHHKKYLVVECEHGKIPIAEYQLEDADMAKYFWKLCVQQNKFYVKTRHLFNSYNWDQIEETAWRSRSMPNLRNNVNLNPLFEMANSRQHLNGLEDQNFTDLPPTISSHPQISYENLAPSFPLSSKFSASLDPCNQAYSTESLNHGSSMYQLDSQLAASSTSIPFHPVQQQQTAGAYVQNYGDQRQVVLPAYRAAPDYETAMKQKYGGGIAATSQVSLSDRLRLPPAASHSYDSSLDRVQPSHHHHLRNLMSSEMMMQQPEMKSYAHYENYEDLAHLDENEIPMAFPYRLMTRNEEMSAVDGFAAGGMMYHHPPNAHLHAAAMHMQGLKPNAMYTDLPIHTYSTPELTTQGLERDLINGQMMSRAQFFVQQLKLNPPHSYIQRSSSSTPDLASQSVANTRQSAAIVSSNPNLMIGHILNNHNGAVINQVPLRNILEPQLDFHLEEAVNSDVDYNPPLRNILENISESEPTFEVRNRIGLVKSNSVPAEVSESDILLRASLSSLRISNENHAEQVPVKSGTAGVQSKQLSNGLTSGKNAESNQNHSQSKDSRCQMYENKRAEGSVFLEFEQVPKKRPDAEYTTALLPENANRNRFKDVLPYEDNRVKLMPTKENKTGYINASHINLSVEDHQRFYIASQGPLPNTVSNFWQMVWEQNAQIIVMLTEVKEHGREKCFQYWPQEQNEKMEFGDYQIIKKFNSSATSYRTSALSLVNLSQKKQRNIWHIQYTDWPDHGCPEDLHGFLGFMEEIDSVRRHAANEIPLGKSRNFPMVVHCSAGVGRSGVTILCDVMIYSLDHNENLEVSKVLSTLRDQRMLTVQTVAQYKFVYSVLIQYLKNSRLI